MEALLAELNDNLKENSELDAVRKANEEKFVKLVEASEKLTQFLKSENKDLLETVENMRTELDSTRSDLDDKCLENQNLNRNLKREEQKNKALTEENVKLKEQIQEGHPRNFETPETAGSTTRSMRKRSRTTCDGSNNSACCMFQALGEQLLGMELSTSNNEGEHVIHLLHPTSGLSFSLTFLNNSSVEESELLYENASLGSLERVAQNG